MEDKADLTDRVVDIVVAYVSKNSIPAAEVPGLISGIHKSLTSLWRGEDTKPVELQQPAVTIKKSLGQDYIICLEDGQKFKSLKRHLRTKFGMSPEDYRAKWNLPKDYPMVAPSYAEARSVLARQMGLGQGGRKPAAKTRGHRGTSA